MSRFYVDVGESARFSKTVSESDVYGFAGISGDFAEVHVDAEFMKRTPFGRRIAHGVLILGYSSTTSTMIARQALARGIDATPVSLGYDKVRFLAPVFIGDTITVNYTIDRVDPERARSISKVEIVNQNGELVAVAEHVMKWVKNTG